MINTKKCRLEFISLLNDMFKINEKNYHKEIMKKLNSLNKYINNEYFYDQELPKISHQFIEKLCDDLAEITNCYNNFLLSKGFDLQEEAKIEAKILETKASNLIPQYQVDKIVNLYNNSSDLTTMLDYYSQIFGTTAIIKALQCGIDIFCKERKHIFPKKEINIDGKITDNFVDLVNKIRARYSVDVIEKYLVIGLMSNVIFETKNNNNVNTTIILNKVKNIKNRRNYD